MDGILHSFAPDITNKRDKEIGPNDINGSESNGGSPKLVPS